MQNDMLKNNIAPWQEKGRWYHAKLDSNGFILDKTDKFILDNLVLDVTGNYIRIGVKNTVYNNIRYQIIDIKTSDDEPVTLSGNLSLQIGDYAYSNGRIVKYLHSVITDGSFDAWLFIK